jgi:hypothetical protein
MNTVLLAMIALTFARHRRPKRRGRQAPDDRGGNDKKDVLFYKKEPKNFYPVFEVVVP